MAQLITTTRRRANGATATVYLVRWRGVGGRMAQETVASDSGISAPLRSAKAKLRWAENLEASLKGEKPPHNPKFAGGGVPFKDVADAYLRERAARGIEGTTKHDLRAMVNNHLAPWAESRGLTDVRRIGTAEVRAFRDDLVADRLRATISGGKALSLRTKRGLLVLLKNVLAYAAEQGLLADAPGQTVRIASTNSERTAAALKRAERFFRPAEVRTLLTAADSLADDPDLRKRKAWRQGGYHAMVYFAAYSGL